MSMSLTKLRRFLAESTATAGKAAMPVVASLDSVYASSEPEDVAGATGLIQSLADAGAFDVAGPTDTAKMAAKAASVLRAATLASLAKQSGQAPASCHGKAWKMVQGTAEDAKVLMSLARDASQWDKALAEERGREWTGPEGPDAVEGKRGGIQGKTLTPCQLACRFARDRVLAAGWLVD